MLVLAVLNSSIWPCNQDIVYGKNDPGLLGGAYGAVNRKFLKVDLGEGFGMNKGKNRTQSYST